MKFVAIELIQTKFILHFIIAITVKQRMSMNKLYIFLLMFTLTACYDYNRVKKEAYKKNNIHAKELLLNGYNKKIDEFLDGETIDRALDGDEEAKRIIYAQMQILKGMPSTKTHIVPAPVIIQR